MDELTSELAVLRLRLFVLYASCKTGSICLFVLETSRYPPSSAILRHQKIYSCNFLLFHVIIRQESFTEVKVLHCNRSLPQRRRGARVVAYLFIEKWFKKLSVFENINLVTLLLRALAKQGFADSSTFHVEVFLTIAVAAAKLLAAE